MYENIPVEMRAFDSWVVWRYEERDGDKPTKVPYSAITNRHAAVNDSSTWCSYENAIKALSTGMWSGIGFVLTEHDPYGFIDLDEPKLPNGEPLDPKEYAIRMDRQHKIFQEFDSYAELSPSGKGLHIIIKGAVESGRKRSSIEIYSNLRFMTMTGNIYRNAPIREYNETFNILWNEMGKGKEASLYYAGLENPTDTDEAVINMASTASNGEKFHDLYTVGNWEKYYPSQSEADLALIDIIAFYSHNRAQIQRIFLSSQLGQREKSRAQYRINYALNKSFDRILPPIDMDGLRNQLNEAMEKNRLAVEAKVPAIQLSENYLNLPAPAEYVETSSIYSRPAGLLGEIAEYIYAQAPLPVAEIALSAAIGLMAGIVGKAYNVSNTGLNQYVILLSLTGTGKESMSSGISKLMTEVKKTVPTASEFIGPSTISSEQAMIKYLTNKSSCFVSIFGEFAIMLKQMSDDRAPPHMLGVRKMLLDLYNKSGAGDEAAGMVYSDMTKNTSAVKAPAFSILCESSPEIYYGALEESMITGGLLPRFLTIENKNDRVDLNEGASLARPSFDLVQKLATLCANCMNLMHQKKTYDVKKDDEATKIFKDFQAYCTNNIRGSKEIRRQLWNRAHIKAMKLAALVAVGINPFEATIDRHSADWAIQIIIADIRNLSQRFETGEVGADNEETQQLVATIAMFKDYVIRPFSELETYGVKSNLHQERIVPYGYLQKRLSQVKAFRKDRQGATNALKRTIGLLVSRGDIQEVPKQKLHKDFGVTAMCYMITTPKAFGL
jgi:hypothetical protein